MSSYAGIYVNGKEIFTYRNEVFPEIMYLFAENELLYLKGREALPYASNWHVGIVDEGPDEVEIHVYRTTASVLSDRLRVLGFGDALVRKVVEGLLKRATEIKAGVLASFRGQEFESEVRKELEALRALDYEAWIADVGAHIRSKKSAPKPDWRNKGPLDLFDEADERVLLRVITDQVAPDEPVVLDVSDLVEGGYLNNGHAEGNEWQSSWDLGSGPPIVITEGSYDAQVLRGAVEVLKPHLASYIRFLDYDAGNEGGAVAAVRMLKSFAAAGVSNRIVALFDNDSAAYEAVMHLRGSKLPSYYVVMHYPDLELANAYPTLGPQGNTIMNINRLAGSIELYLGRDVLDSRGGELSPVQWKGYMGRVGAYQGEVVNKAALQRAFREKLKAARADPALIFSQDWSGLALILDKLIDTLSSLSTIGPTGGARS